MASLLEQDLGGAVVARLLRQAGLRAAASTRSLSGRCLDNGVHAVELTDVIRQLV